jgi:xanthine dehydrogenase YagR molybdenum-binding subunit
VEKFRLPGSQDVSYCPYWLRVGVTEPARNEELLHSGPRLRSRLHDLALYEVPVHADIPHQDVIFLDETDPMSSPMKAKGVAELGICGVAAAVANAIYNATGVRVREYPITLDKLLDRLPSIS